MPSTDTKYYMDSLIIATVLIDDSIIKQANVSSFVAQLIDAVYQYVERHIDKDHKTESVFNLLAPSILTASGFGILGFFLWVAERFGFNPGKMLEEIGIGIKDAVMSGKPVAPDHVDAIAEQVVKNNYGSDPTEADEQRLKSGITLRQSQIYKVALTQAYTNKSILEKQAQLAPAFRLFGMKAFTSSILSKILGWITKTVLAACGFMVLGTFWEHVSSRGTDTVLNTPSAPTSTVGPTAAPAVQHLFIVDPAYEDTKLNVNSGWIEGVPPSQIENQIVAWTQEIYPKLRGKESFIRSSQLLLEVAQMIQQYNSNNTSNVTFMPKKFTSRKQVVDMFIDELAAKAKTLSESDKTTGAMSI